MIVIKLSCKFFYINNLSLRHIISKDRYPMSHNGNIETTFYSNPAGIWETQEKTCLFSTLFVYLSYQCMAEMTHSVEIPLKLG